MIRKIICKGQTKKFEKFSFLKKINSIRKKKRTNAEGLWLSYEVFIDCKPCIWIKERQIVITKITYRAPGAGRSKNQNRQYRKNCY